MLVCKGDVDFNLIVDLYIAAACLCVFAPERVSFVSVHILEKAAHFSVHFCFSFKKGGSKTNSSEFLHFMYTFAFKLAIGIGFYFGC